MSKTLEELKSREAKLKEEQRLSDIQRAEEQKISQDAQRKLEEHNQRVRALQNAENERMDDLRTRAADELYWASFETRTIAMVKRLIDPAYEISMQDRATMIGLQAEHQKVSSRLSLVEEAVFKRKPPGSSETIFDEYTQKLNSMQKHVDSEVSRLSDLLF